MEIKNIAPGKWNVHSDSGNTYTVQMETKFRRYDGGIYFQWSCTCPSRKHPCKHVIAVNNEYPPIDDEAGERQVF